MVSYLTGLPRKPSCRPEEVRKVTEPCCSLDSSVKLNAWRVHSPLWKGAVSPVLKHFQRDAVTALHSAFHVRTVQLFIAFFLKFIQNLPPSELQIIHLSSLLWSQRTNPLPSPYHRICSIGAQLSTTHLSLVPWASLSRFSSSPLELHSSSQTSAHLLKCAPSYTILHTHSEKHSPWSCD